MAVPQWLETERLVLRRHVKGDSVAIAELVNNWNVVRWLSQVPHPYTLKDAEDWIRQTENAWMAGRDYQLVMERKSDHTLIGHIGLTLAKEDLAGELGYWIGEPYWGHGFGTEAAEAVLAFGFDRLNLRSIWARVQPENDRSIAILVNLGLKHVGTQDHYYLAGDETFPTPVLMIDRDTWRAPRVVG